MNQGQNVQKKVGLVLGFEYFNIQRLFGECKGGDIVVIGVCGIREVKRIFIQKEMVYYIKRYLQLQ